MIGLATRLAVSGGRESLVRLVLTALGVAIGTTMLLLAAAADPAIRAQQRQTAWQFTVGAVEPSDRDVDPLLWLLSDDAVAGQTMTVLRVAATGPTSPVPLGLDAVPGDGEVHVSPALADLLQELPTDRLAGRFPAAPTGTISDAHLAGPDDLVAVVGMSPEALRAMDATRVSRIRTDPPDLQFTDFLRMMLGVGAVGLLLPVLVFVSTSTRIGAARREQRFAAMRLAGATPRQVNVVAAVEAGAAAAVGAALGLVGFHLLRPFAAGIEIEGHPSFVENVAVDPLLLALILAAVPTLAVVAAMVSLRRLQISPLGVARRATRPRPTGRRLAPLAIGIVGFVVSVAAATRSTGMEVLIPVMVTFALIIYGIVAVGPWITVLTARVISRTGRRASALLAGRRLEDDPISGFRAVSGLVVAVFVASVFSGVTPAILAQGRSGADSLVDDTTIVASLPPGTPAATGRDALEAATTAGGSGGVLLHEDPDPDRPLTDPPVGRSHTVLVACGDVAVLGIAEPCPTGDAAWVDIGLDGPLRLEPSPHTAADAAAMPVELVVVETDGTAAMTDRVRTAIAGEAPGARPFLGAELQARSDRQLLQLNRLVNLALAVTLAIAGCSLAVAVAAGIIERKRPFTLLRLAGMRLAELRRTALLEAAAPLLLIATASAALGLATAAVIVGLAGGLPWRPPGVGYWACLGAGLAVALGLTAAALPLLDRATAPSAARFE